MNKISCKHRKPVLFELFLIRRKNMLQKSIAALSKRHCFNLWFDLGFDFPLTLPPFPLPDVLVKFVFSNFKLKYVFNITIRTVNVFLILLIPLNEPSARKACRNLSLKVRYHTKNLPLHLNMASFLIEKRRGDWEPFIMIKF